MAKGKFPGFGGGMNMGNMMKQMQKMQQDMEDIQKKLEEEEEEASSGGGAVTVVATCSKRIKKVTIKPEAVDIEDLETLEDLIMAATNEALRKADEKYNSEMSKIAGGLGGGFPGLF